MTVHAPRAQAGGVRQRAGGAMALTGTRREAGKGPVDELERALRPDGGHQDGQVLVHDVASVRHAACHVLAADRALRPDGGHQDDQVLEHDSTSGHRAACHAGLAAAAVAAAAAGAAAGGAVHAAHDLELGTAPPALRPKDDEPLAAPAATAAALVLGTVHEEHQHAPLLLQGAKSGAARPGDVADAIAGHVDAGAIVALLPTVHV
eukprot:CAMPEP_0204532068 /NCGR_PEP_ID=MMETSP0661-20131031/11525_1 /ASSEMBLY_ACC=CAM_ASM_000606 /TAXON_ID=109239 /ORGANISM="Alexandrium margalefi, Strain AMGDE01CS-322" /LENGTH=205 /DNA_ID=CAMNT_0051538283 /DNA_START=306 /DNA_END=921 /DNA_ORIENTATION=-